MRQWGSRTRPARALCPVLAVLALLCCAAPAQAVEDRIAFIGFDSTTQVRALYLMESDGSGHQLVMEGAEGSPAWSPDGMKIAYVHSRYGNPEIEVLDLSSSTTTRLTNDPAAEGSPTWAPDGTRIAFHSNRDGDQEIYVADAADGQNFAKLTDNTIADRQPDWAPDGSQIAFVRGRDVSLMDPAGGAQTQLTPSDENCADLPQIGHQFPDWSPDSTRIVYALEGLNDGDPDRCYVIKVINRDGTGSATVTALADLPVNPVWGPTGLKIAYSDFKIRTINLDGTGRSDPLVPANLFTAGLDWRAVPDDTPSSHARPKSASPHRVPLVPAYRECTARAYMHGPPLAYGSCEPLLHSQHVTMGIGDGDPAPARSVGFVRFATWVGAPGPPDEADVGIRFSLTSVMRRLEGEPEYTGELRAQIPARITDEEGPVSVTMEDFELAFTVPCVATPDIEPDKAKCALTTTLETLIPGAAVERSRAIWAFGRTAVYDGGFDQNAETTGDNELFAVQGLFVP